MWCPRGSVPGSNCSRDHHMPQVTTERELSRRSGARQSSVSEPYWYVGVPGEQAGHRMSHSDDDATLRTDVSPREQSCVTPRNGQQLSAGLTRVSVMRTKYAQAGLSRLPEVGGPAEERRSRRGRGSVLRLPRAAPLHPAVPRRLQSGLHHSPRPHTDVDSAEALW